MLISCKHELYESKYWEANLTEIDTKFISYLSLSLLRLIVGRCRPVRLLVTLGMMCTNYIVESSASMCSEDLVIHMFHST